MSLGESHLEGLGRTCLEVRGVIRACLTQPLRMGKVKKDLFSFLITPFPEPHPTPVPLNQGLGLMGHGTVFP